MKIPLEKGQGGTEDTSWRKCIPLKTFFPFCKRGLTEIRNILTLYQKGGFGGGKHLAPLSHSLLPKYFWKITTNWTCGLMILQVHWGIVGRPIKTFSTSGVTFLAVRRLVKGTGQSREVSISRKFVSASEECLILQTPS